MDLDARRELIEQIHIFAVARKKCTLKEFQWITGHVNWALNAFLLLKHGLSAVYVKTAGKEWDLATIRVNAAIVFELTWVAHRVKFMSGVHFLKSVEWDSRHVDSGAVSVFTDA